MDRRTWQEPLDERMVHEDVRLDRGTLLRIEDGNRLLVFVRRGIVWITQQGDRQDVLLEAGQWFRLNRDGRAVAYALSEARITVTAPLEVRPRWRIDRGTASPAKRGRSGIARRSILRLLLAWWIRQHRRGLSATRIRRLAAERRASTPPPRRRMGAVQP